MDQRFVRYPEGWSLRTELSDLLRCSPVFERHGLDTSGVRWPRRLSPLPEGAEGWAFVPSIDLLLTHPRIGEFRRFGPDYISAYLLTVELFSATIASFGWEVENCICNPDGSIFLDPRAARLYRQRAKRDGPVSAVPVQMGKRWGVTSPEKVLENFPEKISSGGEFPLDPVAVIWVLLQNFYQLNAATQHPTPTMYIDTPGAVYRPGSKIADHNDTPRIEVDFMRGLVVIEWNFKIRTRRRHGSATGWMRGGRHPRS